MHIDSNLWSEDLCFIQRYIFVIEYLTLKFFRKNIFVTENMEKVKDMDGMMKLVRCKADAMTLSGNGKLVWPTSNYSINSNPLTPPEVESVENMERKVE